MAIGVLISIESLGKPQHLHDFRKTHEIEEEEDDEPQSESSKHNTDCDGSAVHQYNPLKMTDWSSVLTSVYNRKH